MVTSFSSTLFYFISTTSSPPYYVTSEHIDVANNLTLSTSLSDALPFRFYAAPNASEYNICNTGSNAVTLCIDIFRDNTSQPHLQTPGYYTGQQWAITNSTNSDGKIVFQLQNDYSGEGAFLTSTSTTDGIYMRGGGVGLSSPAGTSDWFIRDTNNPQDVSTSTSSSSSTSGGPAATVSASNASTNSAASPGSSSPSGNSPSTGLSTGAEAGIGVGVAGIVLLAIVAAFLLWRRRTRKNSAMASEIAYTPMHRQGEHNGKLRSILLPAPVAITENKPPTWNQIHEMNGDATARRQEFGRPELPG